MSGNRIIIGRERDRFFPDPRSITPSADGLVALGGTLSPETLIEAYSKGNFPWEAEHPIPWFSPDPRCVLFPSRFKASRSLRKLDRKGRFRVTADLRFREVMQACASTPRAGQRGTWISPYMVDSYEVLFAQGFGHSVEVWDGNALVGGLYGLALGGAFFGESMFSAAPNASKLGLMHLCATLQRWGFRFIDCQEHTAHLESLGAETVPRVTYLDMLDDALCMPERWNPGGVDLILL